MIKIGQTLKLTPFVMVDFFGRAINRPMLYELEGDECG